MIKKGQKCYQAIESSSLPAEGRRCHVMPTNARPVLGTCAFLTEEKIKLYYYINNRLHLLNGPVLTSKHATSKPTGNRKRKVTACLEGPATSGIKVVG